MQCYIFDIDGTLSDPSHRLHYIQQSPKDWDAFFGACGDDGAHPHVIDLVRELKFAGNSIVFVSGRSDQCRVATEIWLHEAGILGDPGDESPIYMRKRGDHRPDDIVKGELLDQLLADGYEPIMAFDDRKRVVDMWRARGIPCAQVADGDF